MSIFNKIFLDDERSPCDVTWIELCEKKGWYIVRNYNDFVSLIEDKIDWLNPPKIISFDHDIASFDIDGKEKTGYDCLKFLIEYCHLNNIFPPECIFHTMNSVGKNNMQSYYNNYLNMLDIINSP